MTNNKTDLISVLENAETLIENEYSCNHGMSLAIRDVKKLLEFVKQIANRENQANRSLELRVIFETMIICVAQDLLKEIGEHTE